MHIATYLEIMLPIICRVSRTYKKNQTILQKQTLGMGTLAYFRHTCTDSTMLLKRLFFKGRIRVKNPKGGNSSPVSNHTGSSPGCDWKKIVVSM